MVCYCKSLKWPILDLLDVHDGISQRYISNLLYSQIRNSNLFSIVKKVKYTDIIHPQNCVVCTVYGMYWMSPSKLYIKFDSLWILTSVLIAKTTDYTPWVQVLFPAKNGEYISYDFKIK